MRASSAIASRTTTSVGFTSTFQQNVGSLALAKRIKQRWPHILTAMGGANCEGTMGLELSRSFEWMDFIFSGRPITASLNWSDASMRGRRSTVWRD